MSSAFFEEKKKTI